MVIDDGQGAEATSHDRVYALLFQDGEHSETHGIYTSVERAKRAFVSLATAGLVEARGGSYSVEEYPLDQPLMGAVVLDNDQLMAVLPGE